MVVTRNKSWTQAEIDYLLANPKLPREELAKHLGRSQNAIRNKQFIIGIRNPRGVWTEEQVQFLRNTNLPIGQIAKTLHKATKSIREKQMEFGIYPKRRMWEQWEIKYLQEHKYDTNKSIAQFLNRTLESISKKRTKLGIQFDERRWLKEEIRFLKSHNELSIKELAQKLNRTKDSVQSKVCVLGLTRHKYWTKEEISYLEHMYSIASGNQLVKRLKRSLCAIRSYARSKGMLSQFELNRTVGEIAKALNGGKPCGSYKGQELLKYGIPYTISPSGNKTYYIVDVMKFWTWAKKNQDKLDFAKLAPYALGYEPAWVEAKRNADILKLHKAQWG